MALVRWCACMENVSGQWNLVSRPILTGHRFDRNFIYDLMIVVLNTEGWKLAINDNGYGVKSEREVEHAQCLVHVRIIVRYTRRETWVFRQVSMNRSTTYPSEDKRRREGDSLGGGRTGGKKIRARLVRTCLGRASSRWFHISWFARQTCLRMRRENRFSPHEKERLRAWYRSLTKIGKVTLQRG